MINFCCYEEWGVGCVTIYVGFYKSSLNSFVLCFFLKFYMS